MRNGLNLITYACIDLQASILASQLKTFGLTPGGALIYETDGDARRLA